MGFVFNYVKMNCEMLAAHFQKKKAQQKPLRSAQKSS